MKMIKTLCAIGVVAASFSAANVMAKVSPEEAAKLGNELTPIGAEKAGNADYIRLNKASIAKWMK